MSRKYRVVFEINGVQKSVYSSESMPNIRRWIADQRKLLHPHLKPNRDWQIYMETESFPDHRKADFKLPRLESLSEQEKTVNKYL